MSFFATLQAQPWFNDVASEFAQLAPDVPSALWQGELESEDATLNPAQQDYKLSGHWGLFQENQGFPTTVGLPAASVAQLQDPKYNAYVAAIAMENAIKKSGATTLEAQVEALERAGWPGTVDAGETATRVANVQSILTAQGGNPATMPTVNFGTGIGPLAGLIPGIGALIQGKGWDAANEAAKKTNAAVVAGQGGGLDSAITSLEQNLLVGGIIIAGITGGFLLLGNSMGAKAVPVPV